MGKAPKPPDPAKQIAAQSQANQEAVTESARLNAVDQYGPWGSTTYQRRDDGTPTSQTISLSPQNQQIFDQQQDITQTLTGKAGKMAGRIPTGPMDISGLPERQTSLGRFGGIDHSIDTSGLGDLKYGVDVPDLVRSVASRSDEVGNMRSGDYLPDLPGINDLGGEAQRVTDAVYGKTQSLLNPEQERAQDRLRQNLVNRGISFDSTAGAAELDRLDRAQSEADNRAAFDAVLAGGQEQSRLFGMASQARNQLFGEDATRTQIDNAAAGQRFGQDLQSGQFANDASGQLFGMNMANAQLNNAARAQGFGERTTQAQFGNAAQQQQFNQGITRANFRNDQRQNALAEQLMRRNQDINEVSALLQGSPAMGMPQFQNTPNYNMQPVDVAGIENRAYQNQLAAHQANNPMGGLFGLGNAAITKWSDRRLKTDIRPMGEAWGLPLYAFRYVWGGVHHIGVMAQDALDKVPEAVREIDGWLAVDYGELRAA